MSLVGIINSDPDIDKLIKDEFRESGENFSLHTAFTADMIREVLNFDLPELVIINLNDPKINFTTVFEQIRQDIWLHNFGIIGIYDSTKIDEKEASVMLQDYNTLAVIEYDRIKLRLMKYIHIIDQNQQLIFQYDLADKLNAVITGSFVIDNDLAAVPVYTGLALTALFQHGYIDSNKKMDIHLVIQELLINAIEHGNCRISFQEKSDYLDEGGHIMDLVALKNEDPEIAQKKVFIEWLVHPEFSRYTIRDEGDGFNVMKYKSNYKSNPENLNGRGIILAKSLVKQLAYNRKGNQVSLLIEHVANLDRETPIGFTGADIILPQPGDVIFREGEDSDFLYYISSGTYTASLGGALVGTIIPGDIFMGEMAFLLNNKRSVTVTANTTGKLIKVSRKRFINIVREYPHYGIFLSKLLARKLARTNRENAKDRII